MNEVTEAKAAVDKPIEVTPTTLPEQLFALMRQLTLVIGGFATLTALLSARDISGILNFLHSSDFVATVIGLLTLAALIYGNLKSRWTKQELIVTADAAPNRVAFVSKK